MNRLTMIALAIACGGCAVLSNVSPIGEGVYMTVVRSNDVNARLAEQQDKALSQATSFCAERGARVEVVKQVATPPTPGQAPSAELDFRCKPGG